MKIQPQLAAALTALLLISNTLPVSAADADRLSEATASSQDNALISDSVPPEEWDTVSSGDPVPFSGDTLIQEPAVAETDESGMTAPDEAPLFCAHVEYSSQGYVTKGTFTEFLPGTSLVQPLYSLDGEVWQTCRTTWNLQWLGSENEDDLKRLQNQTCLYATHEPLSGYLAGQLNRFYLKLQITLENGITYETQSAVIDRGGPRPIPEEYTPVASFVQVMRIRQWQPPGSYGQYQITVSANATPEDISALLPDTLPVDISLYTGIDFVTNAIVNCPVTWKPLSLSRLIAGESVTIEDAAEEIIVPAGTQLNTPHGIFYLNDPLGFNQANAFSLGASDKIRLILNVVAENADPTGVLSYDNNGLQIAFHLKPTGATAIRAYTLSEGGADWVEIPDPLLPEKVNAPSSAASSAYTFLLNNSSEPYQSYLAAWNAGDEPSPFWVGLEIEGGVYDGKQLILAWPDTYELPIELPALKGAGGNECNAGSDNKNDSTSEGQRPGLPQDPVNSPDMQEPESPHNPENELGPGLSQSPKDQQDAQNPKPPQASEYQSETQQSASYIPGSRSDKQPEISQVSGKQRPQLRQILIKELKDRQLEQFQPLEDGTDRQAGQIDSFMQISITKGMPVLVTGVERPMSIPVTTGEISSPSWGKADHKTEHSLHWLLLPAAAAISIGICITAAARKMAATSMSGGIIEKITHAIRKFLHLK